MVKINNKNKKSERVMGNLGHTHGALSSIVV